MVLDVSAAFNAVDYDILVRRLSNRLNIIRQCGVFTHSYTEDTQLDAVLNHRDTLNIRDKVI